MKQMLFIFLAALTTILGCQRLSAQDVQADFYVDGLAYEILSLEQLTCAVIGPTSMDYQGEVVIPKKVIYKDREFEVCWMYMTDYKNVTSITVPNTIDFGSRRVYFDGCTSLKTVIFEGPANSINFYYNESNWSYEEPFLRNVENLYFNRDFYARESDVRFYVKNLVLGPDVRAWGQYKGYLRGKCFENLETLTCEAVNPPIIGSFTDEQYMTLPVFVPEESLEKYKKADIWKAFWCLKGISGINDAVVGDSIEITEVARFNTQGSKVGKDYKGVVIIRYSDGSVEKVMNR